MTQSTTKGGRTLGINGFGRIGKLSLSVARCGQVN